MSAIAAPIQRGVQLVLHFFRAEVLVQNVVEKLAAMEWSDFLPARSKICCDTETRAQGSIAKQNFALSMSPSANA